MRTAGTIATPEGVQLELPLAGIGTALHGDDDRPRVSAARAHRRRSSPLAARRARSARRSPAPFAILVFYFGYHVVFEVAGGGRTLGKRAAGLRVRDGRRRAGRPAREPDPQRPAPASMASRSSTSRRLSRSSPANNQRIGDLAAGTLVVRDTPRAALRAAAPPRSRRRVASWDVAGIGDADVAAVRTFLDRRYGFEPGARAALAADLAGKLRPLVPGVRPGLHDEAVPRASEAAKSRDCPGHRRRGVAPSLTVDESPSMRSE